MSARYLVGCEQSQTITIALRAAGLEAFSCDIKPSTGGRPEWHIQGDVLEHLSDGWAGAIFNPECTFLTYSAEWAFREKQSKKMDPTTLIGAARWAERRKAIDFVLKLAAADIEKIAIENPVSYLIKAWRRPDQYIQPHDYGDDASKKTGLWLKNLPRLRPTKFVEPRWICCGIEIDIESVGKYGCTNCEGENRPLPRWANQTDSGQNREPPSADRASIRSKFYPGWAAAMASQWFL